MKRFSQNQKGFTLIELAIVMVIIGILIGAVLKGQDLIQNARAKKFINDAGRKYEVAVWTYFDRKGRFPGDSDKNGVIGEDTGDDPKSDISNANFISSPDSPVTLGSFSFYVFLGNDGGTPAKNVLVICNSSDCSSTFSSDEVQYIEAFDTAIDGSSDGTAGLVRCATTVSGTDNTKWLINPTSAISATASCDTSAKALLYYFDR
ncbi:MAG: prepilin-type N-terminal cleavage/methylation domain-containing protein, partial [Nitrospirae bacterium]